MRMSIPIITRFEDKIYYALDGCWYWIASLNAYGYGRIRIGEYTKCASRVSYQLFKGEIPNGMYVLHTCDNRACVNPDHLFLGTLSDNTNDAISKGRMIIPDNGRKTPLDADTLKMISEMRCSGFYYNEIAKLIGVSAETMWNYRTGRRSSLIKNTKQ